MALFFRNWIRSGVNKVSDLHFVDGKYDVIIFKNNILSELLTMRQALLPYQEYFMTTNRVPDVQRPSPLIPKKPKDFYIKFKHLLTRDSPVLTEYLKCHSDKDNFTFVFKRKNCSRKRN